MFLVGHFHELKSLQSSLLVWVAFGIGEELSTFIIASMLYVTISESSTGCDINSSFYGKGKSHDGPRGIAFLV